MTESLVAAKNILVLPHKDRAIELQRWVQGEIRVRSDDRGSIKTRFGPCAYSYCSTCLNRDFSHDCRWCFKCSRSVVCGSSSAL